MHFLIKFDKIQPKEDYILDNFLNFYFSKILNKYPSEFNYRYFKHEGFSFYLSMGESYNNIDSKYTNLFKFQIKSENKDVIEFFEFDKNFNNEILNLIIPYYIHKLISENIISSFSLSYNKLHDIVKLNNEYGFTTRSGFNLIHVNFEAPFKDPKYTYSSPCYLESSLALVNKKFYPLYSISLPILGFNKYFNFNFLINEESSYNIFEKFKIDLDKEIFYIKYNEINKLYNISQKEYISKKVNYDSLFNTYHH